VCDVDDGEDDGGQGLHLHQLEVGMWHRLLMVGAWNGDMEMTCGARL